MMNLLIGLSLILQSAALWPQDDHDQFNTRRGACAVTDEPGELWSVSTAYLLSDVYIDSDGSIYVPPAANNGIRAVNEAGETTWENDDLEYLRLTIAGEFVLVENSIVGAQSTDILKLDSSGKVVGTLHSKAEDTFMKVERLVDKELYVYFYTRGPTSQFGSMRSRWIKVFDRDFNELRTVNLEAHEIIDALAVGYDGTTYYVAFCSTSANSPKCLYARDKSGLLLWKFPAGQYTGVDLNDEVAIGPDGTLYVVGRESYGIMLYAIDPSGRLKWPHYFNAYRTVVSFAIDGDGTVVVVGSKEDGLGVVEVVDVDGNPKWSYEVGHACDSAPTIDSSGSVVLSASNHNQWTGEHTKCDPTELSAYVIALDRDGTEKWKHEICNDYCDDFRAYSTIVSDHGRLYLGVSCGKCYGRNCQGPGGSHRYGPAVYALGGDNDAGCNSSWYDGNYGAHDTFYDVHQGVEEPGDGDGAVDGGDGNNLPDVSSVDAPSIGDPGDVTTVNAPGCGCATLEP